MTFPSPRSLGGGAGGYHERSGRIPNPQGPPPPLPNGISFASGDDRSVLAADSDADSIRASAVLRGGCYLMRYTPLQMSPTQPGAIYYQGTLRVQQIGTTVLLSGDLYLKRIPSAGAPPLEPDPGDGIPIFPRGDYRYFLRATQVVASSHPNRSFTLGLEMFRFSHATATWANDGSVAAVLTWTTSPPGYPSETDYLSGEMRNAAGAVVGAITLGWVSEYLRRATLEIDSVKNGVVPVDNGTGLSFKEVFDIVGWDLRVIVSDRDVPETSGNSWSDAEMHAAMLAWRNPLDSLLDSDWRYHLFCVRRIDETERGVMYDRAATDSNSTPREGVGIASDWVYPDDGKWGQLGGKRFGDDAPTYFRTAIHELGHALGLYHNASDNGFMNTTDVIARRAHPERPFPQNIRWAFNPDDEKRLRHMPDLWVRPGGIQFGEDYSVAPIAADDTIAVPAGLEIDVRAVNDVIPLGAPARVDFTITNTSAADVAAPQNLNMRGGAVSGKVIDPSGTVRSFQPLVQCVEGQPLRILAPGESASHSVTLLRGPQGALFPAGGLYRIVIEVRWDDVSGRNGLLGGADLMVTGTADISQGMAVYEILANPDTLVALASSAPSGAGAGAIRNASKNSILGPHYAWLEAKSAAASTDPAKTREALVALDSAQPVLSRAERQKVEHWLDRVEAADPPARTRKTRAKQSNAAGVATKGADMRVLAAKVRRQLATKQPE